MNYQQELQELGEIMTELRKLQKNLITANVANLRMGKYEYGPKLEKAQNAAAYNDSIVKRSRPQVLKSVEQKLDKYKEKFL